MRVGNFLAGSKAPPPRGRIGITLGIVRSSFPRLLSQSIPARVWFMRRDAREVRVFAAGIHAVFRWAEITNFEL